MIHVATFEALNALGRSTDVFRSLSPTASQKIERALRGADLEVHLLFLVAGRYLGGFSSRHSRQMIILPQELSTAYADMRHTTTDQGAPLHGATQDGDSLPRHFYLSLKQIVQDVQALLSYKSTAPQQPSSTGEGDNNSASEEALQTTTPPPPSSVADVLLLTPAQVIQLMPQSLPTLELLLELVAAAGKGGAGTAEHTFLFDIIAHDPHVLFCAPGLKLLGEVMTWATLRRRLFEDIEQYTTGWVEAEATTEESACGVDSSNSGEAASASTRNMLESKGYGLFKQLLIHPFSGPLALQVFGQLPALLKEGDQTRERTPAEATEEVRVFCKAFEVFGFEAVCGNLGGATLAALLGRFSAPSDGGRKRVREDGSGDGSQNEASQVLADRNALVRAAAVAFTAGVESNTHEVRISALARHVLACRSVQCIIAGFLKLVCNESETGLSCALFEDMSLAERTSVTGRALTFIECLCRNASTLMVDNYGNYVMQTLATEAFSHATTTSSAQQLMMKLLTILQSGMETSIWDIATNKCGSNCVEKFVAATEKLESSGCDARIRTFGQNAIVSLAESVVALGPQAYGQLVSHAFANYAIRQLLQRLSGVSLSQKSDDAALQRRALDCECAFYRTLAALMPRLEGNMYATGVRGWFGQHASRLGGVSGGFHQ